VGRADELTENARPRGFGAEQQYGGGISDLAGDRDRDRRAMAPADRDQIRRTVQLGHLGSRREVAKIRCVGREGWIARKRRGRDVGLAGVAQRPGDDRGRPADGLHALNGRRQQGL
jgi:hypothetical protein